MGAFGNKKSFTMAYAGNLAAKVRKFSRKGYVPVFLLMLLGMGTTYALVQVVNRLDMDRLETTFIAAARDRVLVVQHELQSSLNVVQDVGSFFDANPRVKRRQFREFVQPVLKRDPSIQSLEWLPRVSSEARAEFESSAKKEFPRFTITDLAGSRVVSQKKKEHFPLLFSHPYARGRTPLGLDYATLPSEFAMIDQACKSRNVVVSQGTNDLPHSSGMAEIMVYLPVFERWQEEILLQGEPDAIESTDVTGPLRGVAIGRFLVDGIIKRALANLSPSGIDIRFYYNDDLGRPQNLYTHFSRTRSQQSMQVENGGHVREATFEIDLSGSTWRVVCTSVPGSFQTSGWIAGLVLFGGLAFTLLLGAYMLSLIGRAEKVERLVSQRTLELEHSNKALNRQMTERLKAEQALQSLNATLEQRVARRTAEAERRAGELEQFAYVTSHDLKAPLRAIANLASWLAEDLDKKLTQETREQLDLLRDRVGRMHALIEGLLSYSRIGRTEVVPEEVDTRTLVIELIDSLAPPPQFRIEVADDLPSLYTDKLQLGQVFSNLIGNSIKHHHRVDGHIRIGGKDLGSYCEFTVSDDGPGIPAEYHDKVFKMFQTLKVKDFGVDTGIGLALVKKIVEEHGGTINLVSKQGEGTSMHFSWIRDNRGPEYRNRQAGNDR